MVRGPTSEGPAGVASERAQRDILRGKGEGDLSSDDEHEDTVGARVRTPSPSRAACASIPRPRRARGPTGLGRVDRLTATRRRETRTTNDIDNAKTELGKMRDAPMG